MKVARFCGSDILDVQLPRNEVDLRVGVQGLLDAELRVACCWHCFDCCWVGRWNSNNTVECLKNNTCYMII